MDPQSITPKHRDFLVINEKIFSSFQKETVSNLKYKVSPSPAFPLVSQNVIQNLTTMFGFKLARGGQNSLGQSARSFEFTGAWAHNIQLYTCVSQLSSQVSNDCKPHEGRDF